MTGSHSRLGISDRESRTTGVIRAYDIVPRLSWNANMYRLIVTIVQNSMAVFKTFDRPFDTFDKSFDTFDKLFDAFDKPFDAFDKSFDPFDKPFDAKHSINMFCFGEALELAYISTPAQLQCSRSGAWEPGNEATG